MALRQVSRPLLRDGHYGCAPAGHVSSRHHDGFPCWCHYWVHPLQFQSCYHIHGRYGKLVFGLHVGGHLNLWRCQECSDHCTLVPAIALGLPIMDTAFAILRRYKNGRPIFQPDKGHIHHRLLAMGFSQRQAVIFMYLISAGLCLAAVLLTEVDGVYALSFWRYSLPSSSLVPRKSAS